MTNSITTETLTNLVTLTTQTHITPQAVAYTFKEWYGVIGTIMAAGYASCHVIFIFVVHYGGLRKMWSDFMGPKPTPPAAAVEIK